MLRARCFCGIRPLHGPPLLLLATLLAHGQVAQAPASKLLLKAEVVLTSEFCATRVGKGSLMGSLIGLGPPKETFAIGEAACPEIERALKNVFSSLTRVATEPSPGTTSAQVVLVPKFVDVGATRPVYAKREIVVLLEWTAKDQVGKPLWIETVQGSARRREGAFKRNKGIIEDAVKDLAETSAHKVSEAPELRKLVR